MLQYLKVKCSAAAMVHSSKLTSVTTVTSNWRVEQYGRLTLSSGWKQGWMMPFISCREHHALKSVIPFTIDQQPRYPMRLPGA